jgi:PleD family two-component response regulator
MGPARVSRTGHERFRRTPSLMGAATGSAVPTPEVNPDLQNDVHVLIVDDCTLYRNNLADVMMANGATVRVAWDLPTLIASVRETTLHFILLNVATPTRRRCRAACCRS